MTTELEVPQTMHIESVEGANTPPENQQEIHNPNKEVMDAIYEKRKQRLLAEEATQLGDDLKVIEIPAEALPEEKSEESAAPLPAEVATEPTPDPAAGAKLPEKISLKIEGKDIDVPMDTLVTLAQKGLSSAKTWDEAAQMKREAQELMFSMKQNTQPQADTDNAKQSVTDKDQIREIAKRINYGSEEDQVNALLEYGATIEARLGGRSQGPPPEQLVQAATQNAVNQIKFEQDQAIIAKEFPEVFKDKHLSLLAGNIAGEKRLEAENHYRQTGVLKPLVDIWRESLTEVKTKYVPVQSAPPVQAASKVVDMTDKIERKRAAPQPPAAVNRIATENPTPKGVNPSSIVAKMRKARGQPAY